MDEGLIVGIYIGPEREEPMTSVAEVKAVAGRGLEGDRYFQPAKAGEESDPAEEITLVGSEGIEAAATESGIHIRAEDTRRNIITKGIDLGALVGKSFWAGEVEIEALKPNPPCNHLQQVTGKKLLKPLLERGGIRGRIVRSGTIRTGDPIRPL